MSLDTPWARELIGRIIADETERGSAPHVAAAIACDRIYQALSRWVGSSGAHALFTRAHTQSQADHPALRDIRLRSGTTERLEGVVTTGEKLGAITVAAALEALLVALLELLARLIGEDMVVRLVEKGILSLAADPEPRGQ